MNKSSIIALLLMSLFPVHSWGETMDDLVERGGIYVQKFTGEPFTGEVKERTVNGKFKNGREDGPWVMYWNNGQVYFKGNFRNGEEDGFWISYYENGQLWDKGEWRSDNSG